MRRRSGAARAAMFVAGVACLTSAAAAQVKPNLEWRTLRTAHFRVHFAADQEELGRRAAANAERAFAALARELHEPRTPVDLVVADNVDYTNGYATPFPSNRIVVYAHPPADAQSLRYYDDWDALVITHELTHIFHLDRTRGWWRLGQRLFGRNPLLFPNEYAPSWLTEGLAVYFESRLTGFGRIAGSPHRALARAAAAEGRVPRLDQLSAATPEFPGGEAAYAYGSLLVDYLARTRGPGTVRRFVDATARTPVPFFLDRAARRAFGVTFSRAEREWRDSLARTLAPGAATLPGWTERTTRFFELRYPRWAGDSAVLVTGSTGRDVEGLYSVPATGGAMRRVARRNSAEPSTRLPDGSLLYAQLDFVDPYTLRSDLWVEAPDGRERRLTRAARLTHPDASAGGAIVAVENLPGTTRLVRVSSAGTVTALVAASPDTQWAEPRWSPDGSRIAAVRWTRGGTTAIVVLDSSGATRGIAAASTAVESAPSWSSDGHTIYFASDRTGTTQLYAVAAPADGAGPSAPVRLTDAAAGIFSPVAAPGGRTAAVVLRADGYHLALGDAPAGVASPDSGGPRGAPVAAARDSGVVRRYSPWATLAPRYWLPLVGSTDEANTTIGGYTSGADVVDRHAFGAQLVVAPARLSQPELSVDYAYAGLGTPVVATAVSQSWSHDALGRSDGSIVGLLTERVRTAAASLTLSRPGVRRSAAYSFGADVELRRYDTDPPPILDSLAGAAFFRSAPRYPGLFASAAFANTKRPSLSISPEDGVSLSAVARQRWRVADTTDPSTSVLGVARLFRALDLPGYAHHVLAARLSGYTAVGRGRDDVGVGGTSGSTLLVLPGIAVGDQPRSFGVRGFSPSTVSGVTAAGASGEYRLPLNIPARGYGLLPVFLARTSLAAFGDWAAAWCPAADRARFTCFAPAGRSTIASVGAELAVDAGIGFDQLYRFRAGVAAPVQGRELAPRRASAYLTLGYPF